MRYRGVEYTVVQGIERGVWKWSVYVEGMIVTGNEQTRPAAVTAAEKAIDRALVGRTGPPLAINGRHKAMTDKQQTSDVLRILSRCQKPAARRGGRSAKAIFGIDAQKRIWRCTCPRFDRRSDRTRAKPQGKPRRDGRSLARSHRRNTQLCERGRLVIGGGEHRSWRA
jgi:hypothetical protein